MNEDYILVIPARLESTRLPKKLLINIEGKTILERTYINALNAVGDKDKIIIATDSKIIEEHCNSFGANSIITSNKCLTGTDRIAEVAEKISASQYINLQGDEPLFPSDQLQIFINKVTKDNSHVYTAITSINNEEDFRNYSIPKMVFSKSKKLLYSSRAPIPGNKKNIFLNSFKHICVYAFNKTHLECFKNEKEKTKFEFIEDLEINRFLELDIQVKCVDLAFGGKAVDTENDLNKVINIIKTNINS
tara:strand:- start:13408 stop:14151 length:744 start_codon:yes stop_codon:yes gene_type:complete